MAADWAERVANRIKEAKQDRRRSEELELQRGKKISTQAPRLWEQLVETIKSKVAELNNLLDDEPQERLEINTPTNFLATVQKRNHANAKLELMFDGDDPSIKYTLARDIYNPGMTTKTIGRYEFGISDGHAYLHEENIALATQIEDVAEFLLDSLMGS